MTTTTKVMSIADIHLNGGFETDEAEALLKAAGVAIYHNVHVVLVNGDVYHAKSTPIQRRVFKEFLRELVYNKIEVVILRGNHDEEHDLSIFHDPERGVWAFQQPGMVTLRSWSGYPIDVHVIPHYNAAALALEENSIKDLSEAGTGLYDQLLHDIFNKVRASTVMSMVAFHGTITDAHLDNGHIPKHDGIVLNGPILSSIGCPVRGGHYHAAQEPHPNVRYSGSITLRNYGESGDKGVLIDTWEDNQHVGCEFVSLEPAARVTIEAVWNPQMNDFIVFDDATQESYSLAAAVDPGAVLGARVRFRYKVWQSEIPTVDLEPVRQLFANAGVRELKFERDLIIETAIRSERIQQASTVLDMHEAWLGMKNLEEHIPIQRALYNSIVRGIEAAPPKPALELIEGERTHHEAASA